MSRTTRTKPKSGQTIRDCDPRYAASGCQHNNACAYCRSNRTHGSKRREPVNGD